MFYNINDFIDKNKYIICDTFEIFCKCIEYAACEIKDPFWIHEMTLAATTPGHLEKKYNEYLERTGFGFERTEQGNVTGYYLGVDIFFEYEDINFSEYEGISADDCDFIYGTEFSQDLIDNFELILME